MNKSLKINEHRWSYKTIVNSFAAIILSITLIVFNFVRTGMTSFVFGASSLGLLAIILGILPYFSSSHNGLTSVSTYNLIDAFHFANRKNSSHDVLNQKIANLKPQYYLFGGFYFLITLIIAFSFPFYFNNKGLIIVDTTNQIQWYESTLFIISNCVEIWANYFIIPISIILLYLANKSYVYNIWNIFITFILNIIIIVLFICIKNHLINLNFIEMNIIILCILGTKMVLLISILKLYQKKYFAWYKSKKPLSYKIDKKNLMAIASQYLAQFNSDIFAICFIIYAAIKTKNNSISTFHGGEPHGGTIDFLPSAIFSTYLMLIVSSREVVHAIIDAAVPSMIEHIHLNNKQIDRHFFHRYQFLTTYMTSYTISTFLLTIVFSNGLLLEPEHADKHLDFNWILSIGLCLPIFIESITSTYDHLLPIYGEFKKILKLKIIKVLITIVLLAILASSICFTTKKVSNGLFISIICSWSIASLVVFFISKRIINNHIITNDNCGNLHYQTILSYIYISIILTALTPVFIIYQHEINHTIEWIPIYGRILIIVSIGIINLFICLFNQYLFRKKDFLFYKDSILKSRIKKQYIA